MPENYLKSCFRNVQLQKKVANDRTKTSSIEKEMACQNKEFLVSQVKNNAVFAISVDGSNDSNSQLYAIVIVYFDSNEEKIKNSLLALAVLIKFYWAEYW